MLAGCWGLWMGVLTRGVDGLDTGKVEVPGGCVRSGQYAACLMPDLPFGSPSLGMGKRGNESAARGIHMDGNVDARLFLVLVENL